MPIEITELIIRAVSDRPSSGCAGEDDGKGKTESGGGGSCESDAIVRECVRQVMHILRRSQER